MDYNTFSKAFEHNQRTQSHLINLLSNRIDKSSQFSLFIGAGASTSSGVKTASEMILSWRRKLFASYKGPDSFNAWMEKQDWYKSDEEYSRLFQKVYDQPSQRRSYIEKMVNDAKPSWGYAYLASLIKNNIFNIVFTTNFDDLLNDACYFFINNLRPMVCSHDSAVSSVRVISERPKVIKLHGDFLYDSIKNTTTELQSLETNMREKFIEFAKEYGLIVVGYGGSDQSIMDLLDILVRSNSYFRNGIYWCIKKGSLPSRRAQHLFRNDRVFWIEIDGFDEFMADLTEKTQSGLPEAVEYPHEHIFDRFKHLLEKKASLNHPIISTAYGDIKEIYTKVQDSLDKVGLSGWSLKEESPFDELSDKILPRLHCQELMDKKQFSIAAGALRTYLDSNRDNRHGRIAWNMLLKCLLTFRNGHAEARRLLDKTPPLAWQNSTHYLQLAYFSLHLGRAKEALDFSSQALKLNPELIPAKINKALAYFLLNQKNDLKKILKEFESPAIKEQYKAVGYLIKGDIIGTINNLQRSIVLGNYSIDDACRDVAFRMLWGTPVFENNLKQFISNKNFEYPFKEACNMSQAEKRILLKASKITKLSTLIDCS